MHLLFSFFVRLFVAFLAAKFVLGLLDAASPDRLIFLSLILLLNTYLFDLLDWYYDGAWRRTLIPRELGWFLTRFSVRLNSLRRPRRPANPTAEASGKPAAPDRPEG